MEEDHRGEGEEDDHNFKEAGLEVLNLSQNPSKKDDEKKYELLNNFLYCFQSFFFGIFGFLLFFLAKLVFLEDFPKSPILWLIVICSMGYFLEIYPAHHCPLMMLSKLRIKHNLSNLYVSQSLFCSSKHIIAACKIIKNCGSLNMLQSKNSFPNLTGF